MTQVVPLAHGRSLFKHWDRHVTVLFIWSAAIFEAMDQGLKSSPSVAQKAPSFVTSGWWHDLPLIFLLAAGIVWAIGKARKPKITPEDSAIVPQPNQTTDGIVPGIPTLSSLLGQNPSVNADMKQFFARAHYSPITAEAENNIKLVAMRNSPKDKEAFYARFIGVGLVAYYHDETWYTIYGRPAPESGALSIQKKLRHMAQQLRQSANAVTTLYARGKDKTALPADLSPAFVSDYRNRLLGDMHPAYEYVSFVVEYVEKKTGSPRFRELATLIGAAIGNPDFNVEQMKMICFRRSGKGKRSNANRPGKM